LLIAVFTAAEDKGETLKHLVCISCKKDEAALLPWRCKTPLQYAMVAERINKWEKFW